MGVTNYLRSPSQHQCCLDFAKSTQRSNWFALLYTYLDPPRMSNFSTLDLFLVGKGLNFQTLAGFRYIYIYIHTYNRYIYIYICIHLNIFVYLDTLSKSNEELAMNDVPRCKMCVLSRWNRVSKKKRWTSIWPKYMKTSRAAFFGVLPCPGSGKAVFPSHVIQSEESVVFDWYIYIFIYISIYVCFVPFSLIWFPTEMLRTTANSRLFDPHTLTGSMYDIWYTCMYIYIYVYIHVPTSIYPLRTKKGLKINHAKER